MAQAHGCDVADMGAGDFLRALMGGEGAGGFEECEFAAQAVRAEREAKGGAILKRFAGCFDGLKPLAGGEDGLAEFGVSRAPKKAAVLFS